jgi:hypothetical protein
MTVCYERVKMEADFGTEKMMVDCGKETACHVEYIEDCLLSI